ncbi:MAG TPA: hypothetical protein VHO90_08810 [Bacteroidales bacterium]|nr:hypothetical protein [Bacteroidales bacterium]
MPIRNENNRYKAVVVLAALLLSFVSIEVYSQTFPLRTTNQTCFTTKNKTPFLINGCSIECGFGTEELYRNLTQLSFHNVNTLFVSLRASDVVYTLKGKPGRKFKRKVAALKQLVREASFRNWAVVVSPYEADSLSEEDKTRYLELLFKKVYRFSNVLWLLHPGDLNNERLVRLVNPKQLKGLHIKTIDDNAPESADFVVTNDISKLRFKRPAILLLHPGESANDSTARIIRSKLYSAVLKGASGVLIDYSGTKAAKYPSFYLGTLYLKQFKTVFDTLAWHQMNNNRDVDAGDGSLIYPAAFDSKTKRSLILITQFRNIAFSLSDYPHGAKFSWIDTCTGKIYRAYTNGKPEIQLFLPPLSTPINCEWLLVIDSLGD